MQQKPLRIVKHGTSAAVIIPRPVMHALGLNLGEFLVAEVNESRQLVYRRPAARDFQPEAIRPFLAHEPTSSSR